MTPQLLWERRPWTWLFDTWRSVTFVKVSLPSLELRRLDTNLFDSVFLVSPCKTVIGHVILCSSDFLKEYVSSVRNSLRC